MARPVWNGTISFGLLNVPVQIYSGEKSVDLHFRLLDKRDHKPIRYERVNAQTGEEVAWKDIVKAFEYERGNYVVIDEEQIRAAAPEATETVEIEAFVERSAISPLYFEKPYYLVPGKKAEKGYVLLRETLSRTGRVGIAKVVIRTRQYLAALMPLQHALVLNLMRFEQELVPLDQFELPERKPADYRINPREMDMAAQLIDSMSTEWEPAQYRDDFRDKLRRIIDNRIAKQRGTKVGEEEEPPTPPPASTNVVDFMALLQKSLTAKGRSGARTAAARGNGGDGKGGTGRSHAGSAERAAERSAAASRDKSGESKAGSRTGTRRTARAQASRHRAG